MDESQHDARCATMEGAFSVDHDPIVHNNQVNASLRGHVMSLVIEKKLSKMGCTICRHGFHVWIRSILEDLSFPPASRLIASDYALVK